MTLVDFPGLLAATVFTQGCNFRCGYCHNPDLVLPQFFQTPMPPELILGFLNDRRGKLDGVVITGGEPTLQKGLVDFIVQIKAMGFKVKLDTNGSHPEVLAWLFDLKLLDYVAMDIKTSMAKYKQVTGVNDAASKVRESIALVMSSRISYQFRTTLVKEYCSMPDLGDIRELIKGAHHYVLQPFVKSQKMLNAALGEAEHYTSYEFEALKAQYDVKGTL